MLSAWHIVKFKHCVALQYTNNVIRTTLLLDNEEQNL